MTDNERGRLSRRSLITKGAAAGGVLWAAPVIESFVSKAAAASSGLTCQYAFLIYQHGGNANNTFYLKFLLGSQGTCDNTEAKNPNCSFSMACGGVTYSISQTTGTNNAVVMKGATVLSNASGGGDCSGQFNITSTGSSNTITGGSSNTILFAAASTASGGCTQVCPTSGTSVSFTC